MRHRLFDDGFHVDLHQLSTVADALLAAMELARKARAEYRAGNIPDEPLPPLRAPAFFYDTYLRATETTRTEFQQWVKK